MNKREKEFLDTLIEVGIALNREALTKILIDDGSSISITFSPETGWVSVGFRKDGISKGAFRFDQFPEISYQEVDISEGLEDV